MRHDAPHGGTETATQCSVGDDGEGTAEAGNVPRLRWCHERDRSPRHLVVEHRQRQVPAMLVENEPAVDLVGADDEVVAQAEGCDPLEFFALPGATDRVVRMAEQQQPAARQYRVLQRREIVHPALVDLAQRRRRQPPIGQARCAEERRIDRRRRDHVTIDGAAGDVEPAHQAGQPEQPVRLDLPAG